MQEVLLFVAWAIVVGLPNVLCDSCVVPVIRNGQIAVKNKNRQLDWFRFRYRNRVVYDEVEPGSTPTANSQLYISCDDGYSNDGEGQNPVPVFCDNGKWEPHPDCLKNGACIDTLRPSGAFVTYLPPRKTMSSIPEREFDLREESEDYIPEDFSLYTRSKKSRTRTVLPGFHLRETRAIYGCKSKYYELIGSRIRRCQKTGEWSGTPPSCIPKCGRSYSPRSPLISYGDPTDVGQWPWQIAMFEYYPRRNEWSFKCGGSLVNDRWIVTAAHCATYSRSDVPLPPEELKIYLGKYHLNETRDDRLVQVKMVKAVHINPIYNYTEFDADIALLELESPAKLNSRVQPVCLPTEKTTRRNLVEGTKGIVTGWGRNENKKLSNILMQGVLPVVSNAKCIKGFENAGLRLIVTNNMFCAGFDSGKPDSCSGDSGGPVVFKDPFEIKSTWVLEGIVSWGSPQGCGRPNQYGVYTTVSRFMYWIVSYVNS